MSVNTQYGMLGTSVHIQCGTKQTSNFCITIIYAIVDLQTVFHIHEICHMRYEIFFGSHLKSMVMIQNCEVVRMSFFLCHPKYNKMPNTHSLPSQYELPHPDQILGDLYKSLLAFWLHVIWPIQQVFIYLLDCFLEVSWQLNFLPCVLRECCSVKQITSPHLYYDLRQPHH